jgi:hypothetical protein
MPLAHCWNECFCDEATHLVNGVQRKEIVAQLDYITFYEGKVDHISKIAEKFENKTLYYN